MAGKDRTLKLSILGDVDDLKKNLTAGTKEVQSFGDKLGDFSKKAGLAFAAAGAAAVAYAGKLAVEGVKAAIEDEAAQAKLATTLRNVTNATDDQIKAVEEQILKTALLTGKTDDELRPSFDRLLRSTKDITEAQRLQALALDISAGTGKELSAVSEALGKAYDGNLGSLKRLGVGIDESIIKSKDFDAAAAALAITFKDQASTQADTFQGKMLRLTTAFDEAKETVGSYILDGITPLVTSLADNLFPIFTKVNDFISEKLIPTFKEIWDFTKSLLTPIINGLKSAFDKVATSIKDNSEELQPLIGFMKALWEFGKTYLAPFLGGALKIAFEVLGTVIAKLVDGFAFFVNLIDKAYSGLKKIVDLIKNNPLVSSLGGLFGSNASKASNASFGFDMASMTMGGGSATAAGLTGSTRDDLGLDPVAYSALLAWSIKRGLNPTPAVNGVATGIPSEEYNAKMLENLRLFNLEKSMANKPAPTLSTSPAMVMTPTSNIVVNMGVVGDPESAARTIVQILNDSSYRGTGGAGAFA